MRAVSSVVDATLFLLLLGGAVGTLVVGATPDTFERNRAADAGTVLTASTTTVNYSLGGPAAGTDLDAGRRRTSGTVAALLGDAAVAGAALDGRELLRTDADYRDRVRAAAANATRGTAARTSISAVWEPYPDAPLAGTVRVGEAPPRDADVHAATVTVASGVDVSAARARERAAAEGYAGVARAVAAAVVERFAPRAATRLALRGDGPVPELAVRRYHRLAHATGAGPTSVRDASIASVERELVDALAERLRADLSSRFETPEAAAAALSAERVTITVRTWSP